MIIVTNILNFDLLIKYNDLMEVYINYLNTYINQSFENFDLTKIPSFGKAIKISYTLLY